jgi:hypothetical protein
MIAYSTADLEKCFGKDSLFGREFARIQAVRINARRVKPRIRVKAVTSRAERFPGDISQDHEWKNVRISTNVGQLGIRARLSAR